MNICVSMENRKKTKEKQNRVKPLLLNVLFCFQDSYDKDEMG